MSEKTCGVYIFTPTSKLLVCHPNELKSDVWGIPKGRPDEGELDIEAAMREVFEETGIILNTLGNSIRYVGTERYTHKDKILHAYTVILPMEPDVKALKCRSKFTSRISGEKVPEIDGYRLVEFESFKHKIQSEQVRLWEKYSKSLT